MFTPDEMKVMLSFIGRADIKGSEATNAAFVIQKLSHEIQKAEAPKTDVPVKDDDTEE
jgi:hypothetical protein